MVCPRKGDHLHCRGGWYCGSLILKVGRVDVAIGRVQTGTVRAGMNINVSLFNSNTVSGTMERFFKPITEADPGDKMGLD